MITRQIPIFIAALTIGATCFARLVIWPLPAKPALSLSQAEAIGDKTIAHKFMGFFCVRASFTMLGNADQEWELTYTNTKGESKVVRIDAKGNANFYEGGSE